MENKEQNFVSAVIYVYNAEREVGQFLNAVIDTLEENFHHSEIICVNDCSGDGSVEAIRAASRRAAHTSVSVVNMSRYYGLELAMCAGMDLAIGDYVFEFDGTFLDFDPGVIMEVYRKSLEGFDIVSASPNQRERLSSRLFYKVFDRFTSQSYRMGTERFRVLSRRVINRINSTNKTILYRKAAYANCGLKTSNISYRPLSSDAPSAGKREQRYRSELAVNSLILYTEIGYRLSMIMTAVMIMVSFAVLAYTVIAYFTLHPVAGWTTTILFLSVSFIGLFGIQTIILKYLQLLMDMVFKKKHYNFESIEKLTV